MVIENLVYAYYRPSIADSLYAENVSQIILVLSPYYQTIYHTGHLSLTYVLRDEVIYYGTDHSIYNCSFKDLIDIARENGYELKKVPEKWDCKKLMFYYKTLFSQHHLRFIPINDVYYFLESRVPPEKSIGFSKEQKWLIEYWFTKTYVLNFTYIGLVLFFFCFIYTMNNIFCFFFISFSLASVLSLVAFRYETLTIILIVCKVVFVAYVFLYSFFVVEAKFKHLFPNIGLFILITTFLSFLFFFFFSEVTSFVSFLICEYF